VGTATGHALGNAGGAAERVIKGTLSGIAGGTAAALMRGGRVVVQEIVTDAFGNALGNTIVEQASAPQSDLGSGLKLTQQQADSLGKKYDFDPPRYVRPNYALVDDGQSVKLSAFNVKTDLEQLTELFYPKDGARAGFSEGQPLLLAQSSKVMSDAPSGVIPETFSQGYAAGRLREAPSVMRPTNAASLAGRVLGGSLTSTGDMFDALTGRASAEAAYRSFANGDVVNGSLYGLKAIGEAALTVFSGGVGSVALQGARGMTAAELAAVRATYSAESGVAQGVKAVVTGDPALSIVEGSYVLVGANRAIIDPRKITEYALNPLHPVGGNKARVFESALGITKANADDLIAQLREGIKAATPVPGKIDQFGLRFTADISVTGPTGSGVVRSGWIYKAGSQTPELTTVFVK